MGSSGNRVDSLMKLSNSWSLSEAMEVGVFVALPLVVFLEGPADPWVVIGTGFVFDTVEDIGDQEEGSLRPLLKESCYAKLF